MPRFSVSSRVRARAPKTRMRSRCTPGRAVVRTWGDGRPLQTFSNRHFYVREIDGSEVELARDGLAVARSLDLVRPMEAAERHAPARDVALEVRVPCLFPF